MLNIVFILIILYIIIYQLLDTNKPNQELHINKSKQGLDINKSKQENKKENKQELKPLRHNILEKKELKIFEMNVSEPWSKILFNPDDEYQYHYHIKIKIPSLNDYEEWHRIIPNLKFNPNSGELIIPSKDEPAALAIVNLICMNFSKQLTIYEIINKNLIQISIDKAKSHTIVANKLREQIKESISGIVSTVSTNNHEVKQNNISIEEPAVNLTSSNFKDTFLHFSDNNTNLNDNSTYSAF